jgi:hypothetical protein
MMRPLLLALAGTLAVPAVAAAQSGTPQFVGDPVTYLTTGKPATTVNVVFRVNQSLGSGASATVNTSGGPVLATATPKQTGTTGLCYVATFSVPSALSNGGGVDFVLTTSAGALQPNAEVIRQYSYAKVRIPGNLIGGNC